MTTKSLIKAQIRRAAADLNEAATEIERLRAHCEAMAGALNTFVRSAYPVAPEINRRGHNWCEAYLDVARDSAQATISTYRTDYPGNTNG